MTGKQHGCRVVTSEPCQCGCVCEPSCFPQPSRGCSAHLVMALAAGYTHAHTSPNGLNARPCSTPPLSDAVRLCPGLGLHFHFIDCFLSCRQRPLTSLSVCACAQFVCVTQLRRSKYPLVAAVGLTKAGALQPLTAASRPTTGGQSTLWCPCCAQRDRTWL